MSKTNSSFPKVGQVRTLAVSSPLLKLYEHILHCRLKEEVKTLDVLHHLQRGFTEGYSCSDNLVDLLNLIVELKEKERRYRLDGVPKRSRTKSYLLFMDLAKAFDKINRPRLIRKLKVKGFSPQLVNALANLIRNTYISVDGTEVKTLTGVPQGFITSPTFFALFIDDLVSELNAADDAQALAFADDLFIAC